MALKIMREIIPFCVLVVFCVFVLISLQGMKGITQRVYGPNCIVNEGINHLKNVTKNKTLTASWKQPGASSRGPPAGQQANDRPPVTISSPPVTISGPLVGSVINTSREHKSAERCPQSFFKKVTKKYEKLQRLSNKRSVRFKLDPQKIYNETVVIMSPISNAVGHLPGFFNNICRLTYPQRLISLALGEDSSRDDTYKVAKDSLEKLQNNFARVSLSTMKETLPFAKDRHKMEWQLHRRTHLAKSRNSLLSHGLRDEIWVLWIDSDVEYIPPDLIEQLLAAGKDIVAPSCMFQTPATIGTYDLNTWKENEAVKNFLKGKPSDYLMLQGYGAPWATFLAKMKKQGNIVEIDGVGGCVLLVKAEIHRMGLIFPPVIYKNHIETEGLAKMAHDMGVKMYGLPNFEVFHF